MSEYTEKETQAIEQMGDKAEYDRVYPTPFSERHPCPIEPCRLSAEEHHRLAFGMIAENRELKRRLEAFEHGSGAEA